MKKRGARAMPRNLLALGTKNRGYHFARFSRNLNELVKGFSMPSFVQELRSEPAAELPAVFADERALM